MITVLLFAGLRESVGQAQITYPHAPVTVGELIRNLAEQYREARFQGVMAAVGDRYAGPDELIAPGSVVALFPPISGG